MTAIIILIDADRIKSDYMKHVNNNDLPDKMLHEIKAPFKSIEIMKPTVGPEARRIDILLKVGVLLVAMSGLIFATTSWDVIPDVAKIFALLMMGFLFCALSRFNEIKLKIENTTATYWILGMVFFVLSYIAMGYFEIFGSWFSLVGDGSNMYLAFMAIEVSLLAALSYKKFGNAVYLYGIFIGILASIYYTLSFLELGIGAIFLVIILINGLCNFIKSNDVAFVHLAKFSTIMNFVIGFVLINTFETFENNIIVFITAGASILNLLYVGVRDDNKINGALSSILIIVIALFSVFGIDLSLGERIITLVTFYAMSYIVLMVTKVMIKNEMFNITYSVLINIALLLCFYGSYFENEYVVLLTGSSVLLTSIIYYLTVKKSDKLLIEQYIQPFKVLLFVTALLYFLSVNILNLSDTMNLCISFIVMMIMHFVVNDVKLKYKYFLLFCGVLVASLISVLYTEEAIPAAIVLLSSLMPFVIADGSKDIKYNKYSISTFIFLIVTCYLTIIHVDMLSIGNVNAGIVVLLLYGIIMTLARNNRVLYMISSFALLLPINTIIYNIDVNYETSVILYATEFFYLLYLFAKNAKIDVKDKDAMVAVIGSLIMLGTVFNSGVIIGIYVGITSLVIMYIGFTNANYKSLFYVGTGALLLNVIYQLRDLWEKIPFWLYLLVAGLSIIGFVTHNELKKLK